MKKVLFVLIAFVLTSCVDEFNRMENLKKKFPNYKVEPAAGILKKSGYDYVITDSLGEIIGVNFYMFSESKIADFRHIK
jgi:hypothetical protein